MGVFSSQTQRAHSAGLWNGLTLGPLGTVLALLLMMLAETPRTGAPVVAAALGPTTVFLILALVSLVRRQGGTSWWVFSALGLCFLPERDPLLIERCASARIMSAPSSRVRRPRSCATASSAAAASPGTSRAAASTAAP